MFKHLKIYFQSINTKTVVTLPFISMVAAECCFSKLSIRAERKYVISKFRKVYITFFVNGIQK